MSADIETAIRWRDYGECCSSADCVHRAAYDLARMALDRTVERDEARVLRDGHYREIERARVIIDDAKIRIAELEAMLSGAESAHHELSATLVEHSELNGHMEIIEQFRDYLAHEADEGDQTGKLRDFIESLRIVLDQFKRQRRSRNWYEVAYTAGKKRLIESAAAKEIEAIAAWLETETLGVGVAHDQYVRGWNTSKAASIERIRSGAWRPR